MTDLTAAAADREWTLDELADAYAYPETGGPWLRANMVSTLDGAAQHDGRSQGISNATDMRIFGTLRAGRCGGGGGGDRTAGGLPARPRPRGLRGPAYGGRAGPAPAIAVVSASLDLDFSLPLFVSPLVRTLVVTGAGAPSDRIHAAREAGADVVVAGDGAAVEPARAVAELAARGLNRLLTEGGPRLLGQFVAAGCWTSSA
ncbi:dihydrofolate reductase family protein [Streptomyces sp. M10(2022)]